MSIKLEDQDLSKLSPMMQHYLQTKKEYPGCILFYRLGDFYEMFFDDAEIVSRELELTLTGKSCGLPERAPMCGVPFHALDSYLTRLVEKGYKAAICDQVDGNGAGTEAVLVASGLLSTLFGNSLLHAAITAFNAGPNGQSNLSFLTLVW